MQGRSAACLEANPTRVRRSKCGRVKRGSPLDLLRTIEVLTKLGFSGSVLNDGGGAGLRLGSSHISCKPVG